MNSEYDRSDGRILYARRKKEKRKKKEGREGWREVGGKGVYSGRREFPNVTHSEDYRQQENHVLGHHITYPPL